MIEVIGGAGARLSTHLDWREPADLGDDEPGLASRASTVSEPEMLSYLAEEHHHLDGRPWALGRSHADYLLSRGVDSTSGFWTLTRCGKVGVHLIPYLKTGNYVGTDHCLGLLKAFAAYEIPLHGLDRKQPVLLWAGVESLRYVQPGFTMFSTSSSRSTWLVISAENSLTTSYACLARKEDDQPGGCS